MKKLLYGLIAGVLITSAPAAKLFAAEINYSLTAGTDVITFTLPQNPTPSACLLGIDCFSVTPIGLIVDGHAITNGTISFYTPAFSGGLTVLEGSTVEMNDDGPQLFSGTLANPVLETFTNLQLVKEPYYSPVLNEAFVLNASVASGPSPAPEPQSCALFGAGIGILSLAVRRKRNSSALA